MEVELGAQDMRPALFLRWVAGDDPAHVITFPFLVQNSGHRHTALRIAKGAPIDVHVLLGVTGKLVYRAHAVFELPEEPREKIGELLLQAWSVLGVLRENARAIDPELADRVDAGLLDDEDDDPGFRMFTSQLRQAVTRSNARKGKARQARRAARAAKAAGGEKTKKAKVKGKTKAKKQTKPAKSKGKARTGVKRPGRRA